MDVSCGKFRGRFLEDIQDAFELESIDESVSEKISESKMILKDKECVFSTLERQIYHPLKTQAKTFEKSSLSFSNFLKSLLKLKTDHAIIVKQHVQGKPKS